MKILITGASGFIGSALTLKLLQQGHNVIGVDNHNNYYDTKLKDDRIKRQIKFANYIHHIIDIKDKISLEKLFKEYNPQRVVNLAAQAGVRYSIDNPQAYIDSNIVGFLNIIELVRNYEVDHFIYASSSSVYGANTKVPFSLDMTTDHPLSLYAATKKSNELIAHSYSNLYSIPTTGLRFFTVYGPWDRPDMAFHKFAQGICRGEKISIYNDGKHSRDFTFIEDIVEGIYRVIFSRAKSNEKWNGNNPKLGSSSSPWRIYNIGNNKPVNILDLINLLEKSFAKNAIKEFLPMQMGDVENTCADVSGLQNDFDFVPKVSIEEGILKFTNWFKTYYKI